VLANNFEIIGSCHRKATMFGKQDSLPTHGGTPRGNGISGIPVVNKSVALSLLWVVLSICAFIFGIWHCRTYSYSYSLKCSTDQCKYTAFKGSEVAFAFPKSDLVDAELARVNDAGEFMDAEQMRKQKLNRAGYSIRFKARLPVEEGSQLKTEKAIIFAPRDMGRREARNGVTSITKYIHSTDKKANEEPEDEKDSIWKKMVKNKTVDVYYGRSFTALGAITSFLSIVSLIAAFTFGTWSETSRRARVKKAS
jgi:hypothetical protein